MGDNGAQPRTQNPSRICHVMASQRFARLGGYHSRWNTPGFTSYCMRQYRIPAVSVEMPYALAGELLLTRDHYREIGARMAKAVLKRLKTDRT